MTQLRPIDDRVGPFGFIGTNDSWTLPAYSAINEAVYSDASYTELPLATVSSYHRMGLTSTSAPANLTACQLQIRVQRVTAGVDDANCAVVAYIRDDSNGGTIAGPFTIVTASAIPVDAAFHAYTIATDISSLTLAADWTNISVVIGANSQAGSTPKLRVSWLEFDLPVAWWQLVLPTMTLYFAGAQPSAYTLPFDIFSGGVFYPAGTSIAWITTTEPTDKGWWVSSDLFAGAGYLVNNDSRPKAPRGYVELPTLATGATLWAGGTSCAVFNNHLVYAEGGYTVGTTSPSIRIYDGLTDRPLASIPNTSAGAVPKAITAMLTANGVVYIATLDSGSSSADWVGRVFALDIESGQLTPMGAALTTGHVPYALCWHAGRLWCGTHRQSTAASGKVFYLRPGIDSDWTADYDLATSSVSSVTSLLSFQGKLYVGTNNAAASFAKILVRDTAGTYTTSLTLSGGVAAAGNGVPAMVEFGSALYASFYNADTPVIATIRKFDGSSWTTAYSGSGTTLVPFIAMPIDGTTTLFAVGGGLGISAVLLKTADGTTWTDQSVYLQQTTTASSGLPACGTIVH